MPGVNLVRVESADDDRLSEFRNVPDPQLLTRLGLFVAEGRMVVARLLASGLETRALLVTDAAFASLRDLLVDRTFPIYVVPQAVMDGVTGFHFHRGCLAIGVRPPARDWREVMAGSTNQDPAYVHRLVVLERIGNVDNVGSIFRNAAALRSGWSPAAGGLRRPAVPQGDPHVDGGVAARCPTQRRPGPTRCGSLATAGWATVAMTPAQDAPLLQDVATALTSRSVAIVLGHEGDGLTDEARAACTHRARIAMADWRGFGERGDGGRDRALRICGRQ